MRRETVIENHSRINSGQAIIWGLLLSHFLLAVIGSLFIIMHWPLGSLFLFLSVLTLLVAWILVILDLLKSENRLKFIWILSLIALPNVAAIAYLLARR